MNADCGPGVRLALARIARIKFIASALARREFIAWTASAHLARHKLMVVWMYDCRKGANAYSSGRPSSIRSTQCGSPARSQASRSFS